MLTATLALGRPATLGRPLARLPAPLAPRCAHPACSYSSVADTVSAALWVAVAAYGSSILATEYIGRGWLNPDVPLRVGPSQVPGAGRGVFAGADLSAATLLGHYPGRLVNPYRYEQKRQAVPRCSGYSWVLDDGVGVLDPTDARGVLLEPLPRLVLPGSDGGEGSSLTAALGSIPTTLALINEPSLGLDVNVVTEQRGTTLLFSTGRDVAEGEELFLDYGPVYDRSGYGKSGD